MRARTAHGIFGGSGVGKSTLLGSLARHHGAYVAVIALIGERNREVRDFIEHELGPEGLAKSVVVVATSDRPCRSVCARRSSPWPSASISAIRAKRSAHHGFGDSPGDGAA